MNDVQKKQQGPARNNKEQDKTSNNWEGTMNEGQWTRNDEQKEQEGPVRNNKEQQGKTRNAEQGTRNDERWTRNDERGIMKKEVYFMNQFSL